MGRFFFWILIGVIIVITVVVVTTSRPVVAPTNKTNANIVNVPLNTNISAANNNSSPVQNTNTTPANVNAVNSTSKVVVPITGFFERITKKPFGIYITPKTSPVQPEKFTGYHTGADAETTSAEATVDIPIYSLADGTVVFAGHVNGYGGVVMIRHVIQGETMTALYGHVRQSSITVKVGDKTKTGQKFAVLGTGFTSETDGERKHLHLGIIKGAAINYKGYVQTKGALSAWDDPVTWLHSNEAQ